MLNNLQNPLALAARVLLALLFIPAGWGKLGAGFAGTAGYVASVGLPAPQLLAGAGLAIELVGGVLLLIGLFTRWSALALAIFTLVAAFFFHNFWAMPAAQQMMQSLMFWKNLAIVGGLFAITAFGPGAFSVDAKRGKA
jgi:putative oxidoreductase